jgi:hypothetical protein
MVGLRLAMAGITVENELERLASMGNLDVKISPKLDR